MISRLSKGQNRDTGELAGVYQRSASTTRGVWQGHRPAGDRPSKDPNRIARLLGDAHARPTGPLWRDHTHQSDGSFRRRPLRRGRQMVREAGGASAVESLSGVMRTRDAQISRLPSVPRYAPVTARLCQLNQPAHHDTSRLAAPGSLLGNLLLIHHRTVIAAPLSAGLPGACGTPRPPTIRVVYQAGSLGDGQPPTAVALASIAKNGRLVIYTGAGLSRAAPTDLPSGPEVAQRTYRRLSELLDEMPPCDQGDLTSVADAIAGILGGGEAVRQVAVGVAEYTTAKPNYGHHILALLLLEGVVTVLTTNWDDCIERGAPPERVLVVMSEDERLEVTAPALLKVHGCATRERTLLITSGELANPPQWVREEMNARITDSHVVFVGTGDVAGYIKARIGEVIAAAGHVDHLFVVSPGIVAHWDHSQWAELIPNLPLANRIGMPADEFLDKLAGAYVRLNFIDVLAAVETDVPLREAIDRVKAAFDAETALRSLMWFRSVAVPARAGDSVFKEQAIATALIALGKLGQDGLKTTSPGRALAGDTEYHLLVGVGFQSAARLRREAEERLTEYLEKGGDLAEAPKFLVAGAVGGFSARGALPEDIVGVGDVADVLGGPLAASVDIVDANRVVVA
jgi:SIR2-like domain